MKRVFNKFREKIALKESPPPYSVNEGAGSEQHASPHRHRHQPRTEGPACAVLDLLADCNITTDSEYAEIADMGLWPSTPLATRHNSKISLTWVLKENTDNKLPLKKIQNTDIQQRQNEAARLQRQRVQTERYQRKCNRDVRDTSRVVGRNEHYHHLRFQSACEEFVNGQPYSAGSGADECARRHSRRHKRKQKSHRDKFGYDIRDLDSFLSEASLDRPGNIPVVIAYPSTLYQTHEECERRVTLPLGTVVNAVFKSQHWVYAQTAHGEQGYVLYAACLPLGILPARPSPHTKQKNTPCWESNTDIYPRPCGNLTDTEKEQLRGRARSEPRCHACPSPHRLRPRARAARAARAERHFDSLYLRTRSVTTLREHEDRPAPAPAAALPVNSVERHMLLVVSADYAGCERDNTVSVHKGDVVALVRASETDAPADWFHVRKRDGRQGFIPAAVAGDGYI